MAVIRRNYWTGLPFPNNVRECLRMPKHSPYVSRILSSSKMLRIILFGRTPVFLVTFLLLTRLVLLLSFTVIALLTLNVNSVFAIGSTPEALNMRLVGFNNLQARSAYQTIIYQQDGRWIAYIGLHGGEALNPLIKVTTGEVEGGSRPKQQ